MVRLVTFTLCLALSVAIALAFTSCSSNTGTETVTELATFEAKASYAIGMDVGGYAKQAELDIDPAALVQGFKDAQSEGETLLTPEEITEIRTELGQRLQSGRQRQMDEVGEKNIKEGEVFLAENKTKTGVVTTASGLQYRVITEGDGPKPSASDRVSVHYRGTLIDGTEFDSSHKRGAPATFGVGGVISGWTEALQLMNVGSKYELFIPSDLAYGERGSGAQIGPHSVLIFEVELLDIEK